jgi:mRNA interferase MazF
MKEGNVVLADLPQADGQYKARPAVVLRVMPPFNDCLLCGISTQKHQEVVGFDELITPLDADFASSKLKGASLIRLGFLIVYADRQIHGVIGSISEPRRKRLLRKLSEHLVR